MKAIAKFEKVSYDQFEKDWEKNMGGSKEEIKAIYDSIKLPHRATKQSAGYDFYLFKNSEKEGHYCVLYRRYDGTYGILEDTK